MENQKSLKIKEDLLWTDSTLIQEVTQSKKEDTVVTNKEVKEEKKIVQIIPLSEKQFLDFNSIDASEIKTGEVELSWKSHVSVDKIQVIFSNPTSEYPNDDYTLQTYDPKMGEFTYRASSKNKVLDFGENNYIFRAYSGDDVSETKIVLLMEGEDSTSVETSIETDILGKEDNFVAVEFPTSSKYGEPIKLWEASFTYSGIKGFEVKKEVFSAPTCEWITAFLQDRINTWFYWNTCRDIVKDKGIKFNVLRLEGEKYVYERHYLDFKQGLYGVYELERWSGVTNENIAEKNTELKEQEFPSLEVVDGLMRDIVNS